MTTLLNQALLLTLVGMGMTFAALGLLVLGMYAMTALISDEPRRKKAPVEEAPAEEVVVTQAADVILHLATARQLDVVAGERELAAATAVALALALEADTPDTRYRAAAAAVAMAMASGDAAPASTNAVAIPDAWNMHVRSQHLTQRQRFTHL